MPIRIPDKLPANKILSEENIFVMTEKRAATQDIRPLQIAILNLMPTKIVTETQLMRLLSNSPLQVEITLLRMGSHASENKNTSAEHLETFYHTFQEVKERHFDGLIVTGAPVENLDFTEVDYWDELTELFDWSRTHVTSTFHICWAAMAGLYYHYGIPKYPLPKKISGVFPHKVRKSKRKLLRGFDDIFNAPHSRYTENREEDIKKVPELDILATGSEAGVFLVATKDGRQVFATGHLEYDRETLHLEYERDLGKGINPDIPKNYYPYDNPKNTPVHSWRAHANLLFCNWLNYYVYQTTPYDIDSIKE